MKQKIILYIVSVAMVIISLSVHYNAHTNSGGAPQGNTNSPSDNYNCTGCHSGLPITLAGMIQSNVPGTGYIPGSVYSFSATVTQSSANKFGFQISPQDVNGTYLGNMVVTNTVTTQIVSAKYITHTSSGTSGIGTKTWMFDWVAPTVGTGNVTFYGAFNAANNDANTSGDTIFLSSLMVSEDLTSGFTKLDPTSHISIYPNPASQKININIDFIKEGITKVSLLDLKGGYIKTIFNRYTTAGKFSELFDINDIEKGTYFILIENSNRNNLKRFIVVD